MKCIERQIICLIRDVERYFEICFNYHVTLKYLLIMMGRQIKCLLRQINTLSAETNCMNGQSIILYSIERQLICLARDFGSCASAASMRLLMFNTHTLEDTDKTGRVPGAVWNRDQHQGRELREFVSFVFISRFS
jgi:hypothetical protein